MSTVKERWWLGITITTGILGGFQGAVGWISGSTLGETVDAFGVLKGLYARIPVLGNQTFQNMMAFVSLISVVSGVTYLVIARIRHKPEVPPQGAIQQQLITVDISPIDCSQCDGGGNAFGIYPAPCLVCLGTGILPREITKHRKCRYCGGNGHEAGIYPESCQLCLGYGYRIPTNIREPLMEAFFKKHAPK